MRSALLRMIQSPDRWLQAVGAKTAATLGLHEYADPIEALLERQSAPASDAAARRFREVIEASAVKLRA
jgi:hypothetical protein